MTSPYEQRLQTLMAQAGLPSYRALSAAASVSRSTLAYLRRGDIDRLRVATLRRLGEALQVSVAELLDQFGPGEFGSGETRAITPVTPALSPASEVAALRQEYDRLQRQLATQADTVRQQVQREAIAQLEPWLVQWPKLVQATQHKPDLPASKAIPLVRPVSQLLETWGVTPIGALGAEVAYDPTLHQPQNPAIVPGQTVQISRLGYRQGDHLLYRAEVKLLG